MYRPPKRNVVGRSWLVPRRADVPEPPRHGLPRAGVGLAQRTGLQRGAPRAGAHSSPPAGQRLAHVDRTNPATSRALTVCTNRETMCTNRLCNMVLKVRLQFAC